MRRESGDQLSQMGAAPDIRQISCIDTPSCATAYSPASGLGPGRTPKHATRAPSGEYDGHT
jgi:hypothetical protein